MDNAVVEMANIAEIVEQAIPTFSGDSKKARYLSYRISNFSIRESIKLAKVSDKQVRRWRDADSKFAHLDGDGLTELRKTMANEFLDMQFTRNFRMVLEKDFTVLYKDATGDPMTASELKYMEKIRGHYTPQSLAMVKQLLKGGDIDKPFDFTSLTLQIQREQITIVRQGTGA